MTQYTLGYEDLSDSDKPVQREEVLDATSQAAAIREAREFLEDHVSGESALWDDAGVEIDFKTEVLSKFSN
ncbi:hypothetical protein [Salinicola halimionae]|uniref:hypothetical protein n=1 Tax=Salinicola halimionae TaxID=1949081 RepID=UPI000DA1B539|nr:hypothetical protein [Salinicola halimionae]